MHESKKQNHADTRAAQHKTKQKTQVAHTHENKNTHNQQYNTPSTQKQISETQYTNKSKIAHAR